MHESGRKVLEHQPTLTTTQPSGDCSKVTANTTNFLNQHSEALIRPQTILSAVSRLLARPEDVQENADLAASLVEIANSLISDVAYELDEDEEEIVAV